jgi:hypothetical protein
VPLAREDVGVRSRAVPHPASHSDPGFLLRDPQSTHQSLFSYAPEPTVPPSHCLLSPSPAMTLTQPSRTPWAPLSLLHLGSNASWVIGASGETFLSLSVRECDGEARPDHVAVQIHRALCSIVSVVHWRGGHCREELRPQFSLI